MFGRSFKSRVFTELVPKYCQNMQQIETAQQFLGNLFDTEPDFHETKDPLILVKALYLFCPQVDLLWFSR
jgi:hypothetical protein